MLRRVVLFFALIPLAAGAHENPDFKATAHTVAILSLLGDDVQSRGDISVPDAGFDDVAEQAMAGQIRTDLPGATLVRVGGPRRLLLQQLYGTTGFGDVGMNHLRETLKDWAVAHHADYIVILRKTLGVVERRSSGYSMTDHFTLFGIGLFTGTPIAFLNVTVCDGKTLEVVADLSARDLNWGSIAYGRDDPTPEHLPILTDDIKLMLQSVVPGLVHGVGM